MDGRLKSIIENGTDEILNEILQCILLRKKCLHPRDEMIILTLPKNDIEERKRLIDLASKLLMKKREVDREMLSANFTKLL